MTRRAVRWSRLALALVSAATLAASAAAAPTEARHSMTWYVHEDLIDAGAGRDLAYYETLIESRLLESDILAQGHQGPIDTPCCVSFDPVSVTTFSGAGLDVIETEKLQQRAAEVGSYLRDGLGKIECEAMGDVRGNGLFIGLDWVSDRETKEPDPQGSIRVVNRLKDKGFLTSNAGALFNVVKLRPPLVFAREQADQFLDAFEETIRELY